VGLFARNRIKDPVRGEARVLEMAPTVTAVRQTGKLDLDYRFRLEVTVPGSASYEIEHEEQVPHAKTPLRGDTIAVIVSESDPSRLRIDWDAAPDLAARAIAAAAAAQQGDAAGAAEAFGFKPREKR
jgi:hypothetical protein